MQFTHQSQTTAALFWFHTAGTIQLACRTFNLGNMSRKRLTGRLWINKAAKDWGGGAEVTPTAGKIKQQEAK